MTEMLTLEVRLVFALNFSSRGGGGPNPGRPADLSASQHWRAKKKKK